MTPKRSDNMPEPMNPEGALHAAWHEPGAIVNLRGQAGDAGFLAAATAALGLALPLEPCRTVANANLRLVWAGPDDWFVIEPSGQALPRIAQLREALVGIHAAVTDVSSGYAVLRLSGAPVRDVLAQGCPLDLHPRVFSAGQAAGTHFFKASVWLWRPDADDAMELLVRRSFRNYVQSMLASSARECGMLSAQTRAVPDRGDSAMTGPANG